MVVLKGDRFTQAAISVDHPSCPPVKNITRAKVRMRKGRSFHYIHQCFSCMQCQLGSGWVVEAYEGQRRKSLVTYVCNVSLLFNGLFVINNHTDSYVRYHDWALFTFQVDMMGFIPPVILNRFLQRQPLAIHYLRECAMEIAERQRPSSHARFSLKSNFTSSDSNKTTATAAAATTATTSTEEDMHRDSMDSIDFPSNLLGSFSREHLQMPCYEDPVGISEFIGYNTTPRVKKRQKRRHRCCLLNGTAVATSFGGGGGGGRGGGGDREMLFSSGSCEECRMRAELNFAAVGGGLKND